MKAKSEYDEVLKWVKKGNSIQKACSILGIYRVGFYKRMTKQQKAELKIEKKAIARLGVPSRNSNMADLRTDFESMPFDYDE